MSYLDKPLPSNADAEAIILGSIILDNQLIEEAVLYVVPSDFYSPLNRIFFGLMVELWQSGTTINPITMGELYKSQGSDPSSFGGVHKITALTEGLPYVKSLEEFAVIVRDHAIARKTINACHAISEALLIGEEPVDKILDQGEASLLSLSSKIHSDKPEESKAFWTLADIRPVMEQQFKDYHAGVATGCPTGMKELDDMLDGGGLQRRGVYMVAGPEKTGKTSLALDWATHGAIVEKVTVPIITMEMSKENLAKRLYSAYSGIPYFRFRPGLYDTSVDNTYTRALEGLEEFSKYPIIISDRINGLLEIGRHLRRACEQAEKAGRPILYAIIDYLHLVNYDAGKTQTREQEVSKISRGLKELAMELDIALVVMSSLNRAGLSEGQIPDAHNLRDSGQLAFDAEALMILHNPAYIPGKPYEPRPITDINLIVSRQRNGPTGTIPLKFIGQYMQFMTLSQYAQAFPDASKDEIETKGQTLEKDKELDTLWTQQANQPKTPDEDDVDW